MKSLGTAMRISRESHLFNLLKAEFHDARQPYELFDEFLRHRSYDYSFCLRLVALAKQRTQTPWEIRRLAVLMLEHQILKLHPDRLDEFGLLLTRLDLIGSSGPEQSIVSSVLKEGFSTTDTRGFILELRRKLERLNFVHEGIRGSKTSDTAIRDFIDMSRRDCKLALARYLFTPDETVDEILKHMQVTDGVRDLDTQQLRLVEEEAARTFETLPDFEAGILKRLCETSQIYWVSEATSSELNLLVEYPLTTVVMVIKPPGSDVEFEIKRAGRRGRNPLSVVYARNGYTVAPSHRLDGGSMQCLLRFEARAAARLSAIYRLVHKTEAPIAGYVSRSCVFSVPLRKGEVQTLPYFTDPKLFGEGFGEMRVAMEESIAAFNEEGSANLPALPGDLGLTAHFIGHVAPTQAILSGTSSFRLDRLAGYMSASGPERYFKDGLNVSHSRHEARRLADELLLEILGVYSRPDVRYQNHEQYLEAALSVPENRERADRIYLSLVQQIARFWGTLLAVRGYSRGESFVARNVGLKSFWDEGEWKVRIIFMDHDALAIPERENRFFHALGALPNMIGDERHIWCRLTPERFATSEVGYLQSIYRIGSEIDAKGFALERAAMKEAYKKTQNELITNPELRQFFSQAFADRLLDWDALVSGYLQMKHRDGTWRRRMRRMLNAKGYRREAYDSYLELIEKYREFLGRYPELFHPENGKVV